MKIFRFTCAKRSRNNLSQESSRISHFSYFYLPFIHMTCAFFIECLSRRMAERWLKNDLSRNFFPFPSSFSLHRVSHQTTGKWLHKAESWCSRQKFIEARGWIFPECNLKLFFCFDGIFWKHFLCLWSQRNKVSCRFGCLAAGLQRWFHVQNLVSLSHFVFLLKRKKEKTDWFKFT